MENLKCKICRQLSVKLFLKGERCFGQKCAMIKKSYPPGQKGKKGISRRGFSEYGKGLKEKQKLRRLYGINEQQFRKYIKGVLKKPGKQAPLLLIRKLETRLDNVVFKLGFAVSRLQARKLISHSHFQVNNKKINSPAYELKKDDIVSIRPQSLKNVFFKDVASRLKKHQTPSWLKLNYKNFEGKVVDLLSIEETAPLAEISMIFEYYSR